MYSTCRAQIAPNEWTPPRFQHLDTIIIDFMNQQSIPGCSLSLSLYDRPIYTQGYGVASPGQKVLSTSLFRLASISKVITAIAVLRLVQNNKLGLDQRVFGPHGILSRFRPSSKGDKRLLKITVRHLLQHSAGWDRDQAGDAVFWKLHKVCKGDPYSEETLIKYIMTKKLQFTPGKRHAYSNLGYLILGQVIEAVTGMSYIDYVQQLSPHILPGCARQEDCYPLEVKYYNNRDNVLEPSTSPGDGLVQAQYGGFKMEGTEAYGGLVMSSIDLLTFYDELARKNSSILTDESFQIMLERPDYEHGHQWYGLGLDVQDNGLTWGHTGAMEGTSTTVCHHKSGLTWALLFNTWAKDMDLDGLVKYGLSKISTLPIWMGEFDNKYVIHANEQTIHLLMQLSDVTNYSKSELCLIHANMVEFKGSLHVNTIWIKTSKKYKVFVDKNISNINLFLGKSDLWNGYVSLLESYHYNGDTYYIICIQENYQKIQQEIYINVNANEHLIQVKKHINAGFVMKIQSVVNKANTLLVSAVYDKESKPSHQWQHWLQITIENFVFELGKNSLKNLTPHYVTCYPVGDETYVSAIWSEGRGSVLQRHDVSIYGFLYELQESVKDGVMLEKVCGYYNDAILNFLAVWLK